MFHWAARNRANDMQKSIQRFRFRIPASEKPSSKKSCVSITSWSVKVISIVGSRSLQAFYSSLKLFVRVEVAIVIDIMWCVQSEQETIVGSLKQYSTRRYIIGEKREDWNLKRAASSKRERDVRRQMQRWNRETGSYRMRTYTVRKWYIRPLHRIWRCTQVYRSFRRIIEFQNLQQELMRHVVNVLFILDSFT